MSNQPRPQRIQQSHQPGSNIHRQGMRLNGRPTVSVAPGTRWGNPDTVEEHGRLGAVALFRRRVEVAAPGNWLHPRNIRRHLRGKNLACFCRLDEACHADILLEIANAEEHAA